VPFGSPVRKCISAAQEANLHSLSGKDLLEIGFGKHSIPKHLVTSAGGTWTGIEPKLPASQKAEFGKGGVGYVTEIPFPDCTFDFVVGIQTIEHWAQSLPDPTVEVEHITGLQEIYRVLKPKGSIYFCAPIHLHGHEMFVSGDIQRIRELFDPLLWKNLMIEKWREDYAPLDRYPTPDGDQKSWEGTVRNYPPELLDDIRLNRSVELITIKADKEG
jgi:SAM-dependent methyltransferase